MFEAVAVIAAGADIFPIHPVGAAPFPESVGVENADVPVAAVFVVVIVF